MQVLHFVTLSLLFGVASSKWFHIRKDSLTDCTYDGYAPGGKVKSVGEIKAPVAELSMHGLGGVVGDAKSMADLTSPAISAINEFKDEFSKVAPKLGACLGVFGALTGALMDIGKPGPQDILNSVNTAIEDLTNAMNSKLKQMEGYVDTQVINSEILKVKNNYRASFTLWKNCMREYSAEKATECQMDAVKVLVAQRPKFTPSDLDVEGMKKLDSINRRRVEAGLVLFRDYANLVIMELTPLIEQFCEQNSPEAKHNCKRFSEDLNNEVDFYIRYAQNAVKLIEQANGQMGICGSSIHCGPQHEIYEGAIAVHTANWFECDCIIEDANVKKLCKVKATIRTDGKQPRDYVPYNYPVSTFAQASGEFGGRIVKGEAVKYQNLNRPVVKSYWQKNLLLMIPVWQKAKQNAQPGLQLRLDEEFEDEVMNDPGSLGWYDYSKGFKERMRKAGLKL